MTSFRIFWHNALNQRLITVPRLTASHEVPRTSVFRSLTARLLWGFWMRTLTPGGRYFLIASLLFVFYGAVSFEVQAFVPLAYALAVWFFSAISLALGRPRVALNIHHANRVAAGEKLPVSLDVTGQSRRVGGDIAVIPHRLPTEIRVVPASGAPLPPLAMGARVRAGFELAPEKRGVYALRGYRVTSDFPFGLLNAARVFEAPQKLVVTPAFSPLERLDLPVGTRYQAGGGSFSPSRGESVEYIGNRDYREGDAVRDIDWRATARLSRPIVREYREEFFQRAALILDTFIPIVPRLHSFHEDIDPREEDFERAVSLGAACGEFLNRTDFLVELMATGAQIHTLHAGQGEPSLDELLDILAGVAPSSQASWSDIAANLARHLEGITSIVCIFLDWDEARRALAAQLAASGAAVKIVVVRNNPPSLDPTLDWPGEVPILGAAEFSAGVRQL